MLATLGDRARAYDHTGAHLPHRLTILALPVALTLLLPDWRFSTGGFIDPWVYHGYFRHLQAFVTEMYPGLYYGTRLGWILPGHLAYSLLEPNIASFVLHSVFYVAAVLSLFEIVRRIAGAHCALATALLFGLSLQSIRALGGDYVDGPVIAYMLVSTSLLQQAGASGSLWATVGSGVTAGAMLHSNVGSAFLVPAILSWLVPLTWSSDVWRAAAVRLLGWVLGIALCTAAFAGISLSYGAPWNFFMPSFTWMQGMGMNNPWDKPGLTWILDAPWLFLPIAAFLGAMITAVVPGRRSRLDEARMRALAALVVTLALFVGWDYIGPGATLSVPFYASLFVPLSVVVLGTSVLGTTERSSTTAMAGIAVGAALLLCAAYPQAVPLPQSKWLLAGMFAGLGMTASLIRSGAWAVVMFGLFAVGLQARLAAEPYYSPPGDRADIFKAIDRATTAADRYIGNRRPLLLLEGNPPMGPYFNAFASVYLHGYVVISEAYPAVVEKPTYRMTPGDLVVIVSSHPDERRRLQPVFDSHGVAAMIEGGEKITTKQGPLHLTFVRAIAPEEAVGPAAP